MRLVLSYMVALALQSLNANSKDITTIDDSWKNENLNMLSGAVTPTPVSDVLSDLHSSSDFVLLEVNAFHTEYKEKAIRVKCTLSVKSWRQICVAQLSRSGGQSAAPIC